MISAPARARRRGGAVVLAAVAVTHLAASRPILAADATVTCDDASLQGQRLAREGKHLIDARGQFQRCAASECKALVRDDCNTSIAALNERIPRIVLEAKRGAETIADARVTMDGVPLVERLDGTAIEVDPGDHVFVFAAGDEKVEVRQLVVEAKKGQVVTATFKASSEPPKPASPVPDEPNKGTKQPRDRPPTPTPAAESGSLRTVGLIVGGVGVVGLGIGGYLAAKAKSDRDGAACADLSSCESYNAYNDANSRLKTGWIVIGVGAAVAVGGVVLFATAPSSGPATNVSVGVTGNGVFLRGAF